MANCLLIPFDEKNVEERFWDDEMWDAYVPEGFISDFVLNRRGWETPTKFCIWTGLFIISAIIKREGWLKWGSGKMFPNLFVFIVAPHAINAKTSAINFGVNKILTKLPDYIKDPVTKEKKNFDILTSTTPEAMFKVMSEAIRYSNIVKDGKIYKIKTGSELCMVTSELATFLGRQQYNNGLIEVLTDLYDCPDVLKHATIARGVKVLEDSYLTLLGGITPDGLFASIPEAAFGDGFISRVNVVTELEPMRANPEPREVIGGPTSKDLAKRLAWIAENHQGEYTLSQEVKDVYYPWYKKFRKSLGTDETKLKRGMGRFDIHLLKLAMLIRCQRYQKGNIIELQDYKLAEKIITTTYDEANQLMKKVGLDEKGKSYMKISDDIKKDGNIERYKLLTKNSRKYDANSINIILDRLLQEGKIEVYYGKERKHYTSKNGQETYRWVGKD